MTTVYPIDKEVVTVQKGTYGGKGLKKCPSCKKPLTMQGKCINPDCPSKKK